MRACVTECAEGRVKGSGQGEGGRAPEHVEQSVQHADASRDSRRMGSPSTKMRCSERSVRLDVATVAGERGGEGGGRGLRAACALVTSGHVTNL